MRAEREARPREAVGPPLMLLVDDISKRLGRRDVLFAVRLACARGETVALLGENGAGKSTLLRVVAGVLEPDAGRVLLDGAPLDDLAAAARRRIGYVPEGADPPPHLTVEELVALVAALKGLPAARALPPERAARLGIDPFYRQSIGALSLGQRRRACLAAALVGDPDLLLLDEPTNGLDPDGVAMLATLLGEHAARGGAALVATHDLAFADAARARRVRIAAGRVVPPASPDDREATA